AHLAKKVFSPAEQEQLANADNPQDYFYRLWTLKESLIKKYNLRFPVDMRNLGYNSIDKLGYLNAKIGEKYIFSLIWEYQQEEEIIVYSSRDLSLKNLEFINCPPIKVQVKILNYHN
ncbi:MAG: 4-phosphopantetheinyl transferase family protein, partial [Campylobacter sp.]|nr:4-phosphopantetheinyl transferase family protein [Campylobacter sp.]